VKSKELDRVPLASESLRPVDRVDVTVVVDLAVDLLLPSAGPAARPILAYEWSAGDQLRAEHGYSLLVRTWIGEEVHTVAYDAGLSPTTFLWNCDVLGIKPNEIEAILLSHGHADHHGGLEAVFLRYGRAGLPIVLHPDARLDRRIVFPSGATMHMPPPSVNDLEREGAKVLDNPGPTLWGAGTMLLSGQVERATQYEKGFPFQEKRADNGWVPDTWIWDDQNLVVNLRERGLVVMSGCSHAGVVNVMLNAKRLTGTERIHAFIGGMHLTGGIFESIISATVDDVAALAPDYLVAGHCTGYKALAAMALRFPEKYIASSVGTRYTFTT
jgi:7,8-dihydropterin-6-yl-methyl-4-(beta-D-ribofuranosyl)aminobenzene 5'-phosphate synthase